MITTMPGPGVGAYNLWDFLLAKPASNVEFRSAIPLERNWLVLGQSRPADVANTAATALLLVRTDTRGREIWNKLHEVEGLVEVKKIVPHTKGVLIIADVKKDRKNALWMGIASAAGEILEHKIIGQKDADIFVDDIIKANTGESYALAAYIAEQDSERYSRLYFIDSALNSTLQRSLNFGADSRIAALAHGPRNMIVAFGKMKDAGSTDTAMAVGLAADRTILWHKSYPRGLGSSLSAGVVLPDLDSSAVIATGSILPKDDKTQSAWIARINVINGEMEWERYFRGGRVYEGAAILGNKEDSVTVLVNAPSVPVTDPSQVIATLKDPLRGVKNHDFARIITVNKRGVIVDREDHLNAQGLVVRQLLQAAEGERLLVGYSKAPDTLSEAFAKGIKEGQPIERLPHSVQGWLATIPAAKSYADPCDSR